MSDLEGTVGYSLPKICVLFPMVVGSRRIADDTEAEERNAVQIAGLRNGSGLHIDSQSSREAAFDGIQLCAVGDKPVAGTYQSAMNTAFQSGLVQRQSMFQKRGAPLVHCRQSLHLTVLVTVTAPYIVVRQRVARNYIRHLEASVDAARHTGTHNAVRGKTAYQLRSSHRRIHLTDAALRKYHAVAAKHTFHIVQIPVIRYLLLLHTFRQLAVLAIHGTDNTYRQEHRFPNFSFMN